MAERGGSQVLHQSNGTRLKHGILTPTTDNSGPSSDGPTSKEQKRVYVKTTPCVSLGKAFSIKARKKMIRAGFSDS
jgi:hypothetical protein